MYVKKPKPVEAIHFADHAGALEWLQPGEFSVVSNSAIYVLHDNNCYRAFPGIDYLVRDSKGVYPVRKDEF